MAVSRPPIGRLVFIAIVLAALVIGMLYVMDRAGPRPLPPTPPTRPATVPVTRVAVPRPRVLREFIDLVRLRYPDMPTTRPLEVVLDLSEAGHVLVEHPVLMDPSGTLWITHPDGRSAQEVIENPGAVNIVTCPVSFAHWHRDARSGHWKVSLVVPTRRGDGFELIDENGARILGRGGEYDWHRGFSLADGRLGAPTSDGLAVFTVPRKGMIGESRSPSLFESRGEHAPVEYCFFQNSLIAWAPPTADHPGSVGAIRWLDDSWVRLSGNDWPSSIIQLVPMEDSILQLLRTSGSAGRLAVVSMEKAAVSEEQIIRLIAQLSDVDPRKRDAAYEQLSRYRATFWPIADRVMGVVPPETQARLKSLLRSRITPLLGYCEPVGNELELVARFPAGGCVFYSRRGVLIPQGEAAPVAVSPAWISALPGEAIRLLQGEFLRDLDPRKQRLWPTGTGSWIISDEATGPRIPLGRMSWLQLMPAAERNYTEFVGVDRQGRHLFRRPGRSAPTLIIDPRLPDHRPRLPVWQQSFAGVGWSGRDYLAVQLEGNHLLLATGEWELMDEKKDRFLKADSDVPPAATDQPADLGRPLLTDSEGNVYFDGQRRLVVRRRDGSLLEWALPDRAVGSATPWLVESEPGRLFLFNEPGRILRLRRTPDSPEPFKLDATFTRNVPNVAKLTRMWIDPRGRLVMVWDGTNMAIAFPQGFIPMETRHLIPAHVLEDLAEESSSNK